jgi:predicted glycoside hydrolase/deacetylase ChbG (UPF0249 family)
MTNLRANALLGYPLDARLLLVNADDCGVTHAATVGILRALAAGVVRSTSVMMPCPWAGHALGRLRQRPDVAVGVHLTLVSDFEDYRWGPLAPRDRVPSLLDETGYFPREHPGQPFLARFALDEVEIEFRAQIEAVLAAGVAPTHLDWHCLADGGRPDIFDLTLRLGREYGLALRVFDRARAGRLLAGGLPTIDHDPVDSTRLPTAGKANRYVRMLRGLPAGLSEWMVHPALGSAEARAVDPWWRKRAADLAFYTSPQARETIAAEGIVLLDYRALQTAWRAGRSA